ncbi:MAG: efflux RND transporter periplasmic adaptor subunit [Candidatus Omnitrophota bacterium]
MPLKKTHVFIAAFLLFWIILIGWGAIHTGIKLAKKGQPPPAAESVKEKTEANKEAALKEKGAKTEATPPGQKKQTPAQAQAQAVEPRQILVRALKVKTANFEDVLPVMGSVKGKTETELRFEISGSVKKIYFREGEKIKKGDLIASLEPRDAQLKIDYAKNRLNSSQAAYNSALKKLEVHKKLYEAGAIIKSKLEEVELEAESARYQVESAKNEVELAQNEMAKTSLYANKDGVMGPREVEEGEYATPQDKIGSLFEIKEVFVEVGIVERDIQKVKLNQKARVFVDAYPGVTFEGTVDNIYPIVEGKSRTLTAKIKVANPDSLLFPGMFSRAEILIIELKNAIIVPATCLISSGKGISFIPVVPAQLIEKDEEGVRSGPVQLRRVGLGYVTSDYAQVNSGLSVDDLIVIEAQGEIKDNIRVKIVDIEEMAF